MPAIRRLAARLCWVLLVAAFAARAGVPAGWMPVAGAQGIEVVLCSGQGPVAMELADDGTLHPRQQDTPRDPCPFGLGGAQPLDLAVAIELPQPPPGELRRHAPSLLAARLAAWRALRPPPRGPPAFA